jgi:hypothetical protein
VTLRQIKNNPRGMINISFSEVHKIIYKQHMAVGVIEDIVSPRTGILSRAATLSASGICI